MEGRGVKNKVASQNWFQTGFVKNHWLSANVSLIFLFYFYFFWGYLNVYLVCVQYLGDTEQKDACLGYVSWVICLLSPSHIVASWWITFLSAVTSAGTNQPNMQNPIPSAGIWVTPSAWGCLFILAAFLGVQLWLHGWHRSGSHKLSWGVTCKSQKTWEVPGPQSCVWAVPPLIHGFISLWTCWMPLGGLSFQVKGSP